MKKFGKIISVMLCLCAIVCVCALAACGSNMNGTYKYNEKQTVEYGDMQIENTYFYELTIDGDAYEVMTTVDIGGGFGMTVGYSGKCSIDGTTVKCENADKFYSYAQSTIEDGVPVIDRESKEESESPTPGTGTVASYELNKADGTFKPIK